MACEQTGKQATAYSGGELDPQAAASFEQHMLTCGACTAEVAGTAMLDHSLRGMRTHFAPSPEFTARMIAQRQQKPRSRWFLSRSLPVLSTLAAMVFVVLLSAFLWRGAQRGAQSRQLLAEISDIHAATLASANPVDIVSTNRHVVKPWFEGKLPFGFNVPELANSGFSLDGGRMVYLRQQPGAELLLHYGLHRCSLFIFQDGAAFDRARSEAQGGAFHLQMERRNGLIFFVVGDVEPAALKTLGNSFAAAQ